MLFSMATRNPSAFHSRTGRGWKLDGGITRRGSLSPPGFGLIGTPQGDVAFSVSRTFYHVCGVLSTIPRDRVLSTGRFGSDHVV